MEIARFITMAGLVAGCALMVPITVGAIIEMLASLRTRQFRDAARSEPLRMTDPLPSPIRSTGNGRSPGLRVASLEDARSHRAARGAA